MTKRNEMQRVLDHLRNPYGDIFAERFNDLCGPGYRHCDFGPRNWRTGMPLAIQACHDEDGIETVQLTMPVIKCWQRYERMSKIRRQMVDRLAGESLERFVTVMAAMTTKPERRR